VALKMVKVKNIPPSGQPTASAARSSDPTKVGEADAFDGMWEFTTTGGEFCPLKSFKGTSKNCRHMQRTKATP
jgi:hypothetical protein